MPSRTEVPVGEDPGRHPQLLDALRVIHDPCSVATGVPIDIVDMGLIGTLARDGDSVTVGLCLTSPACWQAIGITQAIDAALMGVDGIRTVRCVFDPTHDWSPDRMDPAQQARLRRIRRLPAA
jgi:metal-sulfur cluster biosynthetic enzyme